MLENVIDYFQGMFGLWLFIIPLMTAVFLSEEIKKIISRLCRRSGEE